MSTKDGGAQITMEVCESTMAPSCTLCSCGCMCLHVFVAVHDPVAQLRCACNVQDLTDEAKEEAAKGGGNIPVGMYN
jgi:hypothetical protein